MACRLWNGFLLPAYMVRRSLSSVRWAQISFMAGALVLMACSRLSAQGLLEPPAAPIPVLPPLDRDKPVEQGRPRGQIKAGPLTLTPGFGMTDLGIDTNVFNDSANRKQDFTVTAGPGADAVLELGRFRLTGTGDLGYVYYSRYAALRGLNESASGVAEFRAFRRLLLYGNHVFRNTKERLNFEVDARARRVDRGYQVGALIGVTPKLTTEITATTSTRRYADDATIDGFQLNQTLNENSRNVAGRVALVLSRLTTVFVTGESSEYRFPLSPERDRYLGTASIGASFKPRALFVGTASVGFQRLEMLNNASLDYSGPVVRMDLRYRLRDSTELGLKGGSYQDNSFEPNHPYAIARGIGASVRQHLFRSVDLFLEATLEARRYAQSPLLNDSRWAGTDFGQQYRATIGVNSVRRTRLDVSIQYAGRESGRAPLRTFEGVRVGASFSVGRFRAGSR